MGDLICKRPAPSFFHSSYKVFTTDFKEVPTGRGNGSELRVNASMAIKCLTHFCIISKLDIVLHSGSKLDNVV